VKCESACNIRLGITTYSYFAGCYICAALTRCIHLITSYIIILLVVRPIPPTAAAAAETQQAFSHLCKIKFQSLTFKTEELKSKLYKYPCFTKLYFSGEREQFLLDALPDVTNDSHH